MSYHTPGPWEVDADHRKDGADQILATDLSTICFMATGRYDREAEANAFLIAAAPDLLAALNEILEEVKDFERRTGKQVKNWPIVARAAIDKARGLDP